MNEKLSFWTVEIFAEQRLKIKSHKRWMKNWVFESQVTPYTGEIFAGKMLKIKSHTMNGIVKYESQDTTYTDLCKQLSSKINTICPNEAFNVTSNSNTIVTRFITSNARQL